jgi:hypothetical protein
MNTKAMKINFIAPEVFPGGCFLGLPATLGKPNRATDC